MPDRPLSAQSERVARAIWDAMVNDEPPDNDTLEREGYFDAARAVLSLLAPIEQAAILAEDAIDTALFAVSGTPAVSGRVSVANLRPAVEGLREAHIALRDALGVVGDDS